MMLFKSKGDGGTRRGELVVVLSFGGGKVKVYQDVDVILSVRKKRS